MQRDDTARNPAVTPIAVMLAALSVPLKISVAPMLPLTMMWYVTQRPVRAQFCLVTVLGLVLTPLLIANTVSSGCPLYPLPFCLDSSALITPEAARAMSATIRDWARGSHGGSGDDVNGMRWIIPWIGNPQNMLMSLLLLLALASLLYLLWRRNLRRHEIAIMLLALVCILVVFATAPALRFGLGYLIILPGLAAGRSAFLARIGRVRIAHAMRSSILTAFAILFFSMMIVRPNTIQARLHNAQPIAGIGLKANLILPPALVHFDYELLERPGSLANAPKVARALNFSYLLTKYCWDSPLPCAPEPIDRIVLRDYDRGLPGGFMREK